MSEPFDPATLGALRDAREVRDPHERETGPRDHHLGCCGRRRCIRTLGPRRDREMVRRRVRGRACNAGFDDGDGRSASRR